MSDGFPAMITARLMLRELTMADADDLLRLRSDESVNRYLGRPPQTPDKVAAFIQQISINIANRNAFYWVIAWKDQPTLFGTICLYNFSGDRHSAEIGYELLPQYQGKGLMDEALKTVLKFGFTGAGLRNIIAVTLAENEPSVGLLLKNGFRPDVEWQFITPEEAGNQVVYYLSAE